MSKEYPVEIYPKPNERIKDSAERIYDLGFRDGRFKERLEASNPLAGWSNLTYAIQAGERIDWEKLDGVEAKCVHPELGTLTRNLARRKGFSEETANGWCEFGENTVWEVALPSGWHGIHGWSVWAKGDLPLRKQTADELEPGTCFRGKTFIEGGSVELSGVVVQGMDYLKTVIFSGIFEDRLACDVEVIETHSGKGTFGKPKEDA